MRIKSGARLAGWAAAGVCALNAVARAEPVAVKEASSSYATSSHLGFAMADQSSTGFKAVSGSLVFLDIAAKLAPSCEIGLRSIGEGGKSSQGEFYRLGAGPLISWHVDKDWVAEAAVTFFNEAGLNAEGGKSYQSRGQQLMLGWERLWVVAPRVGVAWGGFVTYHRGSLAAAPKPTSTAVAQLNTGLSHGMELALRLSL